MFYKKLSQKIFFFIDPETAHSLAIKALKTNLLPKQTVQVDPRLSTHLCGIHFPNPVGIAAGFDKNAEIPDKLCHLGFGFVEVGTITPLPQPGNPKPRIFRLEKDYALINRLGFNNQGYDVVQSKLEKKLSNIILGVNIGANSSSQDKINDYVLGVKKFATLADYIAINISSPNTPGLRNLQNNHMLTELLPRIIAARETTNTNIPIFIKISPDLSIEHIESIANEIKQHDIQGAIVTNTTIQYPTLKTKKHSLHAGGLSGKPLFIRSTAILAHMRNFLGNSHVLIGVGGVDSAETAIEKIRAGADLIQLYTGLVYHGPYLAQKITQGISKILDERKVSSLSSLRGENIDFWLREKI